VKDSSHTIDVLEIDSVTSWTKAVQDLRNESEEGQGERDRDQRSD
jgi:hypothetical protein